MSKCIVAKISCNIGSDEPEDPAQARIAGTIKARRYIDEHAKSELNGMKL